MTATEFIVPLIMLGIGIAVAVIVALTDPDKPAKAKRPKVRYKPNIMTSASGPQSAPPPDYIKDAQQPHAVH